MTNTRKGFTTRCCRLGFAVPLSYTDYCLVEKCAGIVSGATPHQQLLETIVRSGLTDPTVSAIVHWHLGETDQIKLNKWLVSGQVDAVRLIDLLAAARHTRSTFRSSATSQLNT